MHPFAPRRVIHSLSRRKAFLWFSLTLHAGWFHLCPRSSTLFPVRAAHLPGESERTRNTLTAQRNRDRTYSLSDVHLCSVRHCFFGYERVHPPLLDFLELTSQRDPGLLELGRALSERFRVWS